MDPLPKAKGAETEVHLKIEGTRYRVIGEVGDFYIVTLDTGLWPSAAFLYPKGS